MIKKAIGTGHTRVFDKVDLDFILSDSPSCSGNKTLRLCKYSVDCHRNCYATSSNSCNLFGYYERTKSYADNFGVILK